MSVDSYWAVIGMVGCGVTFFVYFRQLIDDNTYVGNDKNSYILFSIITFIGLCFFGMHTGITVS